MSIDSSKGPPDPRPPVAQTGRLLEAREVADLLAVPLTWIRTATRAGLLPHLRLGRYVRYERDVVLAWAADQRSQRIAGRRP
jgi:excisionase family DNA binding protein